MYMQAIQMPVLHADESYILSISIDCTVAMPLQTLPYLHLYEKVKRIRL